MTVTLGGRLLLEARQQLLSGAAHADAARVAKGVASFSGPMRANLVAMLDHFGVHERFGIPSCADPFGRHADLVHYTSAPRYPVFVDGKNYSGAPASARDPMRWWHLQSYFGAEAHQLGQALFVPLSEKVAAALRSLQEAGHLCAEQVLDGLQHPSGANAERIAYLLGRKPRERLSTKTDPAAIDRARDSLRARIADLRRASFWLQQRRSGAQPAVACVTPADRGGPLLLPLIGSRTRGRRDAPERGRSILRPHPAAMARPPLHQRISPPAKHAVSLACFEIARDG